MWDSFRSSLPFALQHHINGNAVYNLSHPLLHLLLDQLEEETSQPFHAVPYDYRISQILVQGMLGASPEVPPKIVREWVKKEGKIKHNAKTFHKWWQQYGRNGEKGTSIIRESEVIANYAGTSLLPHQVLQGKASLIHGATYFSPWNKTTHVS
jgi:hypothetical protein